MIGLCFALFCLVGIIALFGSAFILVLLIPGVVLLALL